MTFSLARAWALKLLLGAWAGAGLMPAVDGHDDGISGLGPADRQDLLDHHNWVRQQQNSSSMYRLVWDAVLEASAQTWADECWFRQVLNLQL